MRLGNRPRTSPAMRMMRTILFDFGGTLDYPQHWLDRFLAHYRAAGIELTREQLDAGFDHATAVAYRSTKMLAAYGLTELVDYLVRVQIEYLGRHGAPEVRDTIGAAAGGMRLPEIAGWITQSFVAESWRGFEVSREVLAALSSRFQLGVVSNFYGNLENILAEADLLRFFGTIADSSSLGIFKPDPGLFIAALKQLGAHPDETAMVGDSLDKDCMPARKLGMTAIWLRQAAAINADSKDNHASDFRPDFTIDALAELAELRWQEQATD
jgi:FMN phosphatase YigB (HAD superfamily)